MVEIRFTLNGEPVSARVRPALPVVRLLRETLDLTGTKPGCEEGECGACTILLDGEAVNSCLLPAALLEGRELVTVEGLASLYFAVADSHDPIEVGNETLYEIRVLNEGSKTATNIRVAAELPPELKPLDGDGPARGVVQGQTVAFEPLARLAPKADALYKVRVQGLVDGDHRIRVQILSDEMQRPVTREESTLVYADQ